jgi:nitrite reductase/ring-hydroxylating ferredoxin subunit
MSWHAIGLDIAVSPTSAMTVPLVLGDTAIILVAWEGRWYAIEDRCSHAGCAFSTDGEIDGSRVICDCHGSEFDVLTGRVLRSPALAPIATYPVRIAEGSLEVEL